MKLLSQISRLMFLLVLLAAAVSTLTIHQSAVYTYSVHSRYELLVNELNNRGRLPMAGYVAGEINNLYQVARHPMHPTELGCGDQAEYVASRLNDELQGWHFSVHYGYGFDSPILLPHQWIRGQGPQGQLLDIDPWSDMYIER